MPDERTHAFSAILHQVRMDNLRGETESYEEYGARTKRMARALGHGTRFTSEEGREEDRQFTKAHQEPIQRILSVHDELRSVKQRKLLAAKEKYNR